MTTVIWHEQSGRDVHALTSQNDDEATRETVTSTTLHINDATPRDLSYSFNKTTGYCKNVDGKRSKVFNVQSHRYGWNLKCLSTTACLHM